MFLEEFGTSLGQKSMARSADALCKWIGPLVLLVIAFRLSEAADESLAASEVELRALVEFRDGMTFLPSSKLGSWVEGGGRGVCSWDGLDCDESGRVVNITLGDEGLEGSVSASLGQLVFLRTLNLSSNRLTGSIPESLGALQLVSVLDISRNALKNEIPSSLGNCSSLQYFDLSHNLLSGLIPDSFGDLQSLQYLSLWNNSLFGRIPTSLVNSASLRILVLSYNFLEGEIPADIVNLQLLEELYLEGNRLSGFIPSSLGNCTNLRDLHIGRNNLTGSIPSSFQFLTSLEYLTLQSNSLERFIPFGLGKCAALKQINLSKNNLTGAIPSSLGYLPQLRVLNLQFNRIEGYIPSTFASLQTLETMQLNNNLLTGHVPIGLGELRQLRNLNLANNELSSSLFPFSGASLEEIRLNNNLITGQFPILSSASESITLLDLSHNLLVGEIPSTIEHLRKVRILDFSANNFSGTIPEAVGSLKHLESLDLSDNMLIGEIPPSIGDLELLTFLNLSSNNLEGAIPIPLWKRFPPDSFVENPFLCAEGKRNDCVPRVVDGGGEGGRVWIYIAVAIGALVGGIVALSAAIWCTWKGKSSSAGVAPITHMSNFSDGVVFKVEDVIRSTNNFNRMNIIGEGSKSVVYMGVLPGGMVIAVKRLVIERNERVVNKLVLEMEMLGQIRHRNWLKMHGYISSPDITALILEYAPNGSLHQQLHGSQTCTLTWKMRLQIAMGIAEALVHIHHEIAKPLIHLDIKPSNVLLDENYVAKVTDLGVTKLLYMGSRSGDSVSAIFGSTGYIPPEYGVSTKVSTKGDVFNFGILVLELLTRRRPTFRFQGDVSLRDWVSEAGASPHGMLTVLDIGIQNELALHEDQIQLMLRVGLLCTETSPAKRPSMKDVRDMLVQIESLTSSKAKG